MSDSSRQTILNAIRAARVPTAELPPLARSEWIHYPDPAQQFAAVLELIGGTCVSVPTLAEAVGRIRELSVVIEAQQIVSVAPGVEVDDAKRVDLERASDPHELVDVDVAVLRGEFGVAENGAIWCTDAGVKHRVVYFLSQHLVLLVPARQIVDNMHQAYERLKLGERGFGMFLAGPSKTADIEQSLVIGAHGARSLTVYLVEEF